MSISEPRTAGDGADRLVARLATVGRVVSLVLAILFAVAVAVLYQAPQVYDAVDDRLLSYYTREARAVEEEAAVLRSPRASPEEIERAIERLERAAERLAGTDDMERLGPARREALRTLAAAHEKRGDTAAAVARLEEAVGLSPRDVTSALGRIRLLVADPNTRERGRADLSELYSRLASDPAVATAMALEALRDGDDALAAEALYRRHRSALMDGVLMRGAWPVTWHDDAGETVAGDAQVTLRGQRLEVIAHQPPMNRAATRLVFGVPLRLDLLLWDPEVRLLSSAVDSRLPLAALAPEVAHLEISASGALRTLGSARAELGLSLPPGHRVPQSLHVFLSATASACLPESMTGRLSDERLRSLSDEAARKGRPAEARFLVEALSCRHADPPEGPIA